MKSYLSVSDNGGERKHPVYSLRGMQRAPETGAPQAALARQEGPHQPHTSRTHQKIMAPSTPVNRERLLATVLIARKQPELAEANQHPEAPVVRPPWPIRRQQPQLLASGGRGEGRETSRGARGLAVRGHPGGHPRASIATHSGRGGRLRGTASRISPATPREHEWTS